MQIRDGVVTIINSANPKGFKLTESFVKYPKLDNTTITLSTNEYFVMGDNRAGSYDSRAWGPLPKSDIIGTPLLRLYPINHIDIRPGSIKN